MISQIELRNFQCHERLAIELSPQVTLLLGPSDAGKSAVIRALRWLVFDRPQGDSFIREGTNSCAVRVKTSQSWIGRRRSGRTNEYRLNGDEFKAWGSGGPPEPITKALNLGPENFQGQHDAAFWLCLTPGELAKQLNAIVNLSVIDEVTQEVASRLRKVRTAKELAGEGLAEAQKAMEGLQGVPSMVAELEQVKRVRQKLFTLDGRLGALRRGTETAQQRRELVARLSQAVEESRRVVKAGEKLLKIGIGQAALEAVTRKIREITGLIRSRLTLAKDWGVLDTHYQRLDASQRLLGGLKHVFREAQEQAEARTRKGQELDGLKQQLRKETEGRCPICGGELSIEL